MTRRKPPPGPPPKASRAEVDARVGVVLELRLAGLGAHAVLAHPTVVGWAVSERQVFRYIAQADERLRKHRERRSGKMLTLALARREDLYRRCLDAGELGTALGVLKDLADLTGLYPDPKLKELVALVKEQDAVIRELTGRVPPRTVEALEPGPGVDGSGPGDPRPAAGTGGEQAEDLGPGAGI